MKPSVILLGLAVFLFQIPFHLARVHETVVGAPHVTPRNGDDPQILSLAQFAVSQHNSKQNAMLELTRVLKVEEQVVAGIVYHITLEANDGGQKKVYKAKVWVKPWENFKELQEFTSVEDRDASACAPADDGREQGWTSVPTHDSGVRLAAEQAIKGIQKRSNSLLPYELLEIILAKYKVFGDNNRYDLVLKLRRGVAEDKFRVEINKSASGKYTFCSMGKP